jgi:hypothetical protein
MEGSEDIAPPGSAPVASPAARLAEEGDGSPCSRQKPPLGEAGLRQAWPRRVAAPQKAFRFWVVMISPFQVMLSQ